MSESKFTAELATKARSMGFTVWSVNQTRGKPKFHMDKGVSDLIMFGFGKTLFVETKVDKNDQSYAQRDFEIRAKQNGSDYIVIRTVDEFLGYCKKKGWAK